MAIPDVSALTFEELVVLKDEVEKLIAARREEEREKFLEANRAMLEALEISPHPASSSVRDEWLQKRRARQDFLGQADRDLDRREFEARETAAMSNPSEPIRFRGPNGEEWTGRGPKPPQWIVDLEAQGRHREEFRIAGRHPSSWKPRPKLP